mmetsp:Transcript_32812/g.69222  ORF Transcript_32812/g.69222 Transcript_32812/m.69222 type:complete len:88 (+) Transcript_32812:187-450(+)
MPAGSSRFHGRWRGSGAALGDCWRLREDKSIIMTLRLDARAMVPRIRRFIFICSTEADRIGYPMVMHRANDSSMAENTIANDDLLCR